MYEGINAPVMDDESIWRDIFKENLEGFGIKNIDVVPLMGSALDNLTGKNYHILFLDTMESGQISGPNVAKRAVELGQKPIIFAACIILIIYLNLINKGNLLLFYIVIFSFFFNGSAAKKMASIARAIT